MKDYVLKLYGEFRKYINFEIEFQKLNAVEKLSILLSSIILYIFVILLITVSLVFFILSLSEIFMSLWGSSILSYFLSGLVILGFIFIFFTLRKYLIINPITRMLSKHLLNPPKLNKDEKK